MSKMILSESQERMIHSGFTRNGNHYTWDDVDEVYFRDDVDDDYIFYDLAESLAEVGEIKWD